MSVTDSHSNQVETEPPKAVIRLWQLVIVAVALILPIILTIIGDVFSLGAPRTYADVLTQVAYVFFVTLNWPFFVLAARVKRTFLKNSPDAMAAYAAIIGGLFGLSIPFVIFYAYFLVLILYRQTLFGSESIDFGYGIFILFSPIPFVWVLAGFFARADLQWGPVAIRRREVL